VLQAIAHELGSLVELVGGAAHCTVLLVPLEKLAQVEEVVVRDRAVESLTTVIEACSKEGFEAKAVPLLRRLAAAQWFTGKASACALMPVVYARAGAKEQSEMVVQFVALSKDAAPMVRRAAVAALGPLSRAAGREVTEKALLAVFHALCRDEQDSVRLLALEAAPVIGSLFDAATNARNVLPGVKVRLVLLLCVCVLAYLSIGVCGRSIVARAVHGCRANLPDCAVLFAAGHHRRVCAYFRQAAARR
jgi:serine/threonine-protein phosphatase 2A regulatory subunit A